MEKSRLLNVGFYCVCIPSKVVIFYCKSLNSLCYFIDVNECLFEELYTCVDEFQRCVNTLGSYKCECDQGLYFIDGECRGKKNFTPLRIYFRFSFHFWLEWPGRWPRRTPISRWLPMWPLTVFINVVSKKGRVVLTLQCPLLWLAKRLHATCVLNQSQKHHQPWHAQSRATRVHLLAFRTHYIPITIHWVSGNMILCA